MEAKDKLHFLIDYENVREAGLEGLEHLYDTDTITIFYSAACEKISKRSMDCISNSVKMELSWI